MATEEANVSAGRLRIVAGPPASGKTTRLLEHFRMALRTRLPGSALWLTPNRRVASVVRDSLLGSSSAVLGSAILTFDQLAGRILQFADVPLAPLTDTMKRQLLSRLIRAAHENGELPYYGPIADSPGLVSLIGDRIAGMKIREIWPERLRADLEANPAPTAQQAEFILLYERYQDILLDEHLFDREGLYWSAREQLRAQRRGPFADVEEIFVDGFGHFAASQLEMLGLLGRGAELTTVSLALWDDEERPALIWAGERAREGLERRFAETEVEWLSEPASTADQGSSRPKRSGSKKATQQRALPGLESSAGQPRDALAHLRRELFRNPRRQTPSENTAGVEILAAAGTRRELELVGRRIKSLLVDGDGQGQPVRPGDIAVVVRQLGPMAGLVNEVFDELGLPYVSETGPALEELPALRRLVGLIHLAIEDWPFRRLISVLGSNDFRPDWATPEALRAASQIVHHLRIAKGRKFLLSRVEKLATGPALPHLAEWEAQRLAEAAQKALPIVQLLDQTLAQLPERASLETWIEQLVRLVTETGWLSVVSERGESNGSPASREQLGWQRLLASLRALVELEQRLERRPVQLSRRQFVNRLAELLRSERLDQTQAEVGHVRVLSAARAEGLAIDYLFLAGLTETSFPQPRSPHDSDDTSPSALARHDAAEMALFYRLVTQARRGLWLSYPALDDRAQPMLPSPYVAEVESTFGRDNQGRPHLKTTKVLDLTPTAAVARVGPLSEPLCDRHWRIAAMAQSLDMGNDERRKNGVRSLGSWVRQARSLSGAANLLDALRLGDDRTQTDAFGPFEGLVNTPAVQQWITAKLADRVWSPSSLESYALCPYRYLLEKLLKVEPLEDILLETDRLRSGEAFHNALEALHRTLNEQQGRPSPLSKFEDATLQELLHGTLDAEFGRLEEADNPLVSALLEIERRQLMTLGAKYLAQQMDYEKKFGFPGGSLAPQHFEVGFGVKAREGLDDTLSTLEPLILSDGNGRTIKISGRIDRLDVATSANGVVFTVIDYKTGSGRRYDLKKLLTGESNTLQLPLYALAARDLLLRESNALPWGVGYWVVKKEGYKAIHCAAESEEGIQPTDDWKQIEGDVKRRVFSILEGIQDGAFPVASSDPECTGTCPYFRGCRINHIRSLGKTWPMPEANRG
jgi:ATP-dependent helicase/DNAse subunit B